MKNWDKEDLDNQILTYAETSLLSGPNINLLKQNTIKSIIVVMFVELGANESL